MNNFTFPWDNYFDKLPSEDKMFQLSNTNESTELTDPYERDLFFGTTKSFITKKLIRIDNDSNNY
jgi:hypothetical protein